MTFCRCCMTFFVYIYVLLRILDNNIFIINSKKDEYLQDIEDIDETQKEATKALENLSKDEEDSKLKEIKKDYPEYFEGEENNKDSDIEGLKKVIDYLEECKDSTKEKLKSELEGSKEDNSYNKNIDSSSDSDSSSEGSVTPTPTSYKEDRTPRAEDYLPKPNQIKDENYETQKNNENVSDSTPSNKSFIEQLIDRISDLMP